MRILNRKPQDGKISISTESLDDLWELEHIIQPGDKVRADTERKIAVGDDRSKQVRKKMRLTIVVEKVQLEHEILRVSGTISEGPEEFISFGDHHSISVDTHNSVLEILKEWDSVALSKLDEAVASKPLNVLVVTFDRESACFAELTRRGYDVVQNLSGDVAKKAPGGGAEDFWKSLADSIAELDGRKSYASIIAASPAFWNEYLLKELPADVRKKTVGASCSAVGENGIREVMTRPEVAQVLETDKTSREEQLVTGVLEAIAADKACYGKDECSEKVGLGQVKTLLVTSTLIGTAREEGWYPELDALLTQTKQAKGNVHLLEHVKEKVDSLGGIAGVLRW